MKKVVEKLTLSKKTISVMESCTGGGVTNSITNIEGASSVILFSAVTYSNEYKIKFGVKKETIDKYSVYSTEVAKEMSKCICDYTLSDYGVGVTGKLNRVDENNLFGSNNEVFISIYDRENDLYYTNRCTVTGKSREENKQEVIDNITNILLEVL